jgi:hypothetical protein
MRNITFCLLWIPFLLTSLKAQVVINEYSASNLESFTDAFGKTEDWIELYNTSSNDVDISGWHLSDKVHKPGKWDIPQGTIIPGNGHLVFLCSGRDGFLYNEYHTNFKLTQTKGSDIVLLSNASETVLESHPLDLTLVEHSHCRSVDGGSDWKISTAPSFGTSNNGTAQVDGYTATPEMSMVGGFYTGNVTITILNNEPNSVLRYTLDGTNPTASSPEYSGPITITETQVVKAQSFSSDPNILPGKMEFNTYFIDEDFSLAVFSVAADEVIDLANGNGSLIPIGSLEYFNTEKEREAVAFGSLNRHGQDSWVLDHRSLDWVTRDEMGYTKAVDAQLFKYSERDEYQKFMFRNSGDDNYPAIDDWAHQGSTHIRDEYVHTLAQLGGMKLDQRAVERVIVFLNGEYWGVYGMRERPVDHDYTDEYYDQGKYDIQYLSTWGSSEAEYGGIQAVADWEDLRNFILENDMSVPGNYQVAKDSISMKSMIDYFLMNLNVVAVDWLNYNTGWWRGRNPEGDHKKWGYILWDLDATFDYYINYTGVPNQDPDATPCDVEEIGDYMDEFFGTEVTDYGTLLDSTQQITIDTSIFCETLMNGSSPYPATDTLFHIVVENDPYCCEVDWDYICQDAYDNLADGWGQAGPNPWNINDFYGNIGSHEKIFLKLLEESPEFKQLYYTRYADLMNTVFTCENMNTILDSMLAVIEPEMPRQIERWGGTLQEWESNVQDLKDFVNARCTLLDDGALDCYDDLTGVFPITLMTEPSWVGEIEFNTIDIQEFPWTGDYFGGVENYIEANVLPDYEDVWTFSHWVSTAGNIISPSVTEDVASLMLTQGDTLIAVYTGGDVQTEDLDSKYDLSVFPNPASNYLRVEFNLEAAQDMQVELYSLSGQLVERFAALNGVQGAGQYSTNLTLDRVPHAGLYILSVRIGEDQKRYKVNIIK